MRKLFFLLILVFLLSVVFSITCPNIPNDTGCTGVGSTCVGQTNNVTGTCTFTQKTNFSSFIYNPTSCSTVTVYCGAAPIPTASNYSTTIFETTQYSQLGGSCHKQGTTPYYMNSPICYYKNGLYVYYQGNKLYQTPSVNTTYTCPNPTTTTCVSGFRTCFNQLYYLNSCVYYFPTAMFLSCSISNCSGTNNFCSGLNCCAPTSMACPACTPTSWSPAVPSTLCTDENIFQKSNCNTVKTTFGTKVRETDLEFCSRLNKCGTTVTLADNCGEIRSVTCPSTCQAGYSCVANSCQQIIDGNCGTANKVYPKTVTYFSPDTFCTSGTKIPLLVPFPPIGGSVSWDCNGINGGITASCTASRESEDCNAPYGEKILHGQSKTYFKYSTVDCESDCESEARDCNNGVLSGSFTESSCSNHCNEEEFSEGAFGLQIGDENVYACNTEKCWLVETFSQKINKRSFTSTNKKVFFVDGIYNPSTINYGQVYDCNSEKCDLLYIPKFYGTTQMPTIFVDRSLVPYRGNLNTDAIYSTSSSDENIFLIFDDGSYKVIEKNPNYLSLGVEELVSFGNYFLFLNRIGSVSYNYPLMKSYYNGSGFSLVSVGVKTVSGSFLIIGENELSPPKLAITAHLNTACSGTDRYNFYAIQADGAISNLKFPIYSSYSSSGNVAAHEAIILGYVNDGFFISYNETTATLCNPSQITQIAFCNTTFSYPQCKKMFAIDGLSTHGSYFYGLQEERGVRSIDGEYFFFIDAEETSYQKSGYLCSEETCKKVLTNILDIQIPLAPSKNGVWAVTNNMLNYCDINSGCRIVSTSHAVTRLFGGKMSGVYASSSDGNISYCDFNSCKLLSSSLIITSASFALLEEKYFIDDVENLFVLDNFGKLNYCNKEECVVLSQAIFNKIQKATILKSPLKACSGLIAENSISCPSDGKTPIEITNSWTLVGDLISACSSALCESYCSTGYFKQGNSCVINSFCGDGDIDAGETCSNCPNDVECQLGQSCISGVCVIPELENSISTLDANYNENNLVLNTSCVLDSDINISINDLDSNLVSFTTIPCLSVLQTINVEAVLENNKTYSVIGEINSPCQVCSKKVFIVVQKSSVATIPDGNIFTALLVLSLILSISFFKKVHKKN